MTKATAATVSAALINGGYLVQVSQTAPNAYTVTAQVVGGTPVDALTVNTFAVAQGVASQIDTVRFV
jgi:hypothetical protein